MEMMPKREGIKMVEPSVIKKKKPIVTTNTNISNNNEGFWCVRHQHWASATNGIGWKNSECHPANYRVEKIGGNRNDLPVELL